MASEGTEPGDGFDATEGAESAGRQCGWTPNGRWCQVCKAWHSEDDAAGERDIGEWFPLAGVRENRQPPPDWLIPGFVFKDSITNLVSPTKHFKSFVTAEFDIWSAELGFRSHAFITESAHDWGARWDAMAAQTPGLDESLMTWSTGPVPLLGQGQTGEAAKRAADAGIEFIIVDIAAKALPPGFDEDSANHVRALAVEIEDEFCARGIAVLLVNHTGHNNTKRQRGSSAWSQYIPTQWTAKKVPYETATVLTGETKFGMQLDDWRFQFEPVSDDDDDADEYGNIPLGRPAITPSIPGVDPGDADYPRWQRVRDLLIRDFRPKPGDAFQATPLRNAVIQACRTEQEEQEETAQMAMGKRVPPQLDLPANRATLGRLFQRHFNFQPDKRREVDGKREMSYIYGGDPR